MKKFLKINVASQAHRRFSSNVSCGLKNPQAARNETLQPFVRWLKSAGWRHAPQILTAAGGCFFQLNELLQRCLFAFARVENIAGCKAVEAKTKVSVVWRTVFQERRSSRYLQTFARHGDKRFEGALSDMSRLDSRFVKAISVAENTQRERQLENSSLALDATSALRKDSQWRCNTSQSNAKSKIRVCTTKSIQRRNNLLEQNEVAGLFLRFTKRHSHSECTINACVLHQGDISRPTKIDSRHSTAIPNLKEVMSLRAILWAFDQDIFPSSRKFVLVALANFAGETGKSFPTVETISHITSQQQDTIRKSLADLVEAEIIADTGKRTGATGQVKVYQLPVHEKASERPPKTGGLKTPENGGLNSDERLVKDPAKPPPKTIERPPLRPPKTGGITRNGNGEREQRTKRDSFEIPIALAGDYFSMAWDSWQTYRRERKKPLCPSTARLQLVKLAGYGVAGAVASINQSIEAGWQGLFEPKSNQSTPKSKYLPGEEWKEALC